MTNDQLIKEIHLLVSSERKITRKILSMINIANSRRIYAISGYSSSLEWLVGEFKYSHSAAYRRVEAAKLLDSNPEISPQLESGKLSISNAALLQKAIRAHDKVATEKLSSDSKAKLIKQVQSCTFREAEKILANEFPEQVKVSESVRPLNETLSRITIHLNDHQLQKLNRVRQLKSHSSNSLADILEFLCDDFLKRKDPLIKQSKSVQSSSSETKAEGELIIERRAPLKKSNPNSAPEIESPTQCASESEAHDVKFKTVSRYIPRKIRDQVFLRDRGRCTYVNPNTGRKCESQSKVQIDHIHPFSLGGVHSIDNLRCLCKTHNLLRVAPKNGRAGQNTKIFRRAEQLLFQD